MKPKVYLETTIPSYLTAWPSRDLIRAAHQQITREWWSARSQFDLFVSQVVLDEVQQGDTEAARRRMESISGITVLEVSQEANFLTKELIFQHSLPRKAAADAAHIAIAVVSGMDYLLTWNCTHIANAVMRHKIEDICRRCGYEPTLMCTPDQLMGEKS